MRITVGRDPPPLENVDPFRRGMTVGAWGSDRERIGVFFQLGLTLAHQAAATNAKHRSRHAHIAIVVTAIPTR